MLKNGCHLQVYLNFAARTNAGLWLEKTTNSTQTQAPSTQQESVPDTSARHTETTTADHEQSYSGPTQASVPSNIDTGPDTEQRPAKRQRKLPEAASLVEVDIDWDVPHNSAAENDTSNSPDNGQSPAKLPPQEGKPSTVGPSSQIAAPQLTLPPKSAKLPVGRPNIGSERASEALPEGAVSAQGLEDYSPSRHGGESPPPRSLSVLHPQVAHMQTDFDNMPQMHISPRIPDSNILKWLGLACFLISRWGWRRA